MKLSKFNFFLPYEDHVLAYNSYSDHYLLLKPILKELIEAADNENNIDGLSEIHPALYNELEKNSFIVKDDVDEVEVVKEISRK